MYFQSILYVIYFIINSVAGGLFFQETIDPSKYAITTPWPNGRIPFQISGVFTPAAQENIINAMNEFHKYTCVRFVPRSDESVYLRITSNMNRNCNSGVGYTGQIYDMNIPEQKCGMKMQIEHELMHAIGFLHEHSRHDRDKFVNIYSQNIASNGMNDFEKREPNPHDTAYPYDYNSIVHYAHNSFTSNGQPTILAKLNPNIVLGPLNGLSETDIKKINDKYSCQATSPPSLENHDIHQQPFYELRPDQQTQQPVNRYNPTVAPLRPDQQTQQPANRYSPTVAPLRPDQQTQPPANRYNPTMTPISNTNLPRISVLPNTRSNFNSNIVSMRVYTDQNPNDLQIRLRVFPNAHNHNVQNVRQVYPSLVNSQNTNYDRNRGIYSN